MNSVPLSEDKTAEEILVPYVWIDNKLKANVSVMDAMLAMEEYAAQFKSKDNIPEPDSQPDELFEEAEAIMVRKFPPEEYGEDGDLAVIYDILRELRDLAKATR